MLTVTELQTSNPPSTATGLRTGEFTAGLKTGLCKEVFALLHETNLCGKSRKPGRAKEAFQRKGQPER
jgi:hypothetical protein